jgi:sortase A
MKRTKSTSERDRFRRTFLLAAGTLATFSLACLGWVGWSLADAALVEARQGSRLDRAMHELDPELSSVDRLSSAASSPTPAEWPELSEGDLVGRIEIGNLGISAIVLAGNGTRTLRRAVGHIPGTSLPGEEGNVGLAGHRDSFFRRLGEVSKGDVIRMLTPYGKMTYEVDRVFVVDPEDVHVLEPRGNGEVLTLVSCYPFYYVGPAPRRFIVQARRLEMDGG